MAISQTPQISVQLFSLREQLKEDYEGTIRRVHDMGFRCVEPAGFPGSSPEQAAKLFVELGLSAPSCHGALPLGDDAQQIIETAQALGHRYLITGCPVGFKENYTNRDALLAMAETYCQAAEYAARYGLQVGYHNHDWDLIEIDGIPAHRIFLANTPDTVLYEADLFWVSRAGLDVSEFIKEIGPRATCLHFKDGLVSQEAEFTEAETEDGKIMVSESAPFMPAGRGQVALQEASKVARYTEYAVVELDRYVGDMVQAVAESYTYLTSTGIARGAVK